MTEGDGMTIDSNTSITDEAGPDELGEANVTAQPELGETSSSDDFAALGAVQVRHLQPGKMEGRSGRAYRFSAGEPVPMSRYDFLGLFKQPNIEARVVDGDRVIVGWCDTCDNWRDLLRHVRRDSQD